MFDSTVSLGLSPLVACNMGVCMGGGGGGRAVIKPQLKKALFMEERTLPGKQNSFSNPLCC